MTGVRLITIFPEILIVLWHWEHNLMRVHS
jgi:hypothetical protein